MRIICSKHSRKKLDPQEQFANPPLASEMIGWEAVHSDNTLTKTAYIKDAYDPDTNPCGTFKPKIKSKVGLPSRAGGD
jgi:hypothetical protein